MRYSLLKSILLASATVAAPVATAAQPPAQAPEVSSVVVTAAASDVQTPIDRRSYSVGKDILGSSGSIADALRTVPGVEVDLHGQLTVRGDANVVIQIDSKPAPAFTGQGRAEALQQMPADRIDRVEVITNPSAAQSPDGSGGIINLVMKQNRGAGTTGSTYVTAGSTTLKRAGATVGYNSATLTVTANAAVSYRRDKSLSVKLRELPDPPTGRFAKHDTNNLSHNLNRGQTAGVNLGYAPTPKDNLSASLSYNHLLMDGHLQNLFQDYDPDGDLQSFQDRASDARFSEFDASVSAGWRHVFGGDGHQLSVDLLSSRSRNSDYNLYRTLSAVPAVPALELSSQYVTYSHAELKAAYVRPDVEGGRLTLGYELKRDGADPRSGSGHGPTVPLITLDPGRNFDIDHHQTVNAGYATYEWAIGDLTALAGLRVEGTDIDLAERNTGVNADQDYVKAFPSLSLAYRLGGSDKLSFSYSKRIQRPPFVLLIPFRIYVDPRNYQEGNPRLRPQETHSLEAAFEKKHDGAYYLATLYYRQNEGEVSPVLRDQGGGVVLSTYDNLGSSRSAGLELVANGRLSKTLTYNTTANVFWSRIDASNIGLGSGERSAAGVGGRVNLNWQATPNDAVQLNLSATGRRLYAQGETKPVYTVNLGYRRKLTARVTATVSVQDLWGTNTFRRDLDTALLRERLKQRSISRAMLVRLDYRFSSGGRGGAQAADPAFEY